jgi:AraC-like DNA-binding protein
MRASHINDGWLDTTSTEAREIIDFRNEGFGPVLSLGRFRYHSATEPLADQQHDDWLVLVFALAGAQHYGVDDSNLLLRAGQVLRVLPGSRYGTGAWPEQRGALAWMIIKAKPLPSGKELGMESHAAKAAFTKLIAPEGPLVFAQPPMATGLLEHVFTTWPKRGDPIYREIIRHELATLILTAAAKICTEDTAAKDSPAYAAARIQAVIEWLGANLRKPIQAEELVALSRLSASRFFQEFKTATGMTPKDYLLRLRVEEAARQLRKAPTRPVTCIAHELGFSSSQYFATVFRRYLGVSPGEHRAKG